MATLRQQYFAMRRLSLKEWVLKALLGGARMAALIAMIFAMVVVLLICRVMRYTAVLCVAFLERFKGVLIKD